MSLLSSPPEAEPAPERSSALVPALAPALESELAAGPFDHPWELAPGLVAPVSDRSARQAAWTVESMLEEPVRDAFALAAPETPRDALVIGCGEGRLAHALIAWGGARVVGLEADEQRLRRAELLRDHFALPPGTLELHAAKSLQTLDATELGPFAVVVLPGLSSIADERAAALRDAHACARGLVALLIDGRERAALETAARDAGFERLEALRPPREAERSYVLADRLVVLARAGAPA